jgi:hypothetical protein
MESASFGVKAKKLGVLFIGAVFITGIIWAIGWALEWRWLQIGGYVTGGLLLVVGVWMGLNAQIAVQIVPTAAKRSARRRTWISAAAMTTSKSNATPATSG